MTVQHGVKAIQVVATTQNFRPRAAPPATIRRAIASTWALSRSAKQRQLFQKIGIQRYARRIIVTRTLKISIYNAVRQRQFITIL